MPMADPRDAKRGKLPVGRAALAAQDIHRQWRAFADRADAFRVAEERPEQSARPGIGIGARVRASPQPAPRRPSPPRSEEHTSELPSLMRLSYARFCLPKKTTT